MATALPTLATAAAGAAYLSAKLRLPNDYHYLKAYFQSTRELANREKDKRLNLFYKLEEHAQNPRIANKTFLIYEDKHWTFKQTYELVLRYAGWLHNTHNVVAGEIIALDFMNSPEFLFLVLAIWSLNAAYAAVNYNLTGPSFIHSVKASTSRLLIIESEVALSALNKETRAAFDAPDFRNHTFPLEYVVFDHGLSTSMNYFPSYRAPDGVRESTKGADIAALMYTSGTTGYPKAAIIPWSRMFAAGDGYRRLLFLEPVTSKKPDVFYTPMPLYHTTAFTLGFNLCLQNATTLAISRKFSVSQFWPEVRRNNVTVIQYVGETLRYLLAAPPSSDDRNHHVRMAFGNGLRGDVWARFKARFGIDTVMEIYGATEGIAATLNWNGNSFSDGAIGTYGAIMSRMNRKTSAIVKVDWNTETPWRNPRTGLCEAVPQDQVGELLFAMDPANMYDRYKGYLGNQKATESKIVRDVLVKGDAYFRTGDVVRRDTDGRLWFSDRIGDTYRWRGENVSTAEVGDIIGHHPMVEEANIYGVKVPGHEGRAGCAAITFKPEALRSNSNPPTPRPEILGSLASYASNSLPKYAVPIFLRVVKEVVLTGNNKQQKVALREEGIDLHRIRRSSQDRIYWLKPGGSRYVEFQVEDYEKLKAGRVRL